MRKLAQVTPTGILYSSDVKSLEDLINDDEAAQREAEAQVGMPARLPPPHPTPARRAAACATPPQRVPAQGKARRRTDKALIFEHAL